MIAHSKSESKSESSISSGNGLQRFSRHAPCPVCGGCDEDSRGDGKRCFGFLANGWINCTREDQSAGCTFHPTSSTYSHRLKGKCQCGVEHNPADPSTGKKTLEKIYQYRDASAAVVHETLRLRLPNGDKTFTQRRPDPDCKDGWRWKEVFADITPVLYRLPELLAAAANQPVWIVEGEKDADNLASRGLLATCNAMGAKKWRDHYSDVLVGRHCLIVPDNDKDGRVHAQQVARSLHGKAASVRIVELPGLPDKGDASDWLAAGGTTAQLEDLASKATEWKPPVAEDAVATIIEDKRYANFTARIVREIVRHEAGETTRHVEIEAKHDDGTQATVTVSAEDFESMGWVSPQLGMKYAIHSGRGMKDRFQHAIRVNSYRKPVELREVYTSLGWHLVGGKDVYLHAGGAIGDNGKTDIRVDLTSELSLYCLPAPDMSRLKEATERVLAITDNLGPEAESVSSIIVSMPFRALLGPSRTVPHFSGTTGTLKTSTACLAARFYAPDLEYSDSMPLSWQSTQAGLERLRYLAKDSLLVIDNLIADGEQAHRDMAKADAVINSQGDLAGKARMRADGTSAPRLDPRGCIISTGECEPRRKSSTGRSHINEFKPGLINLAGLRQCHDDAREGWYAVAIACYARYLAASGRLESKRAELRRLAHEYQAAGMAKYPGCHLRHAEAVGEWLAGLELFLRFAMQHKAITIQRVEIYLARVKDQLFRTLPLQAEIQDESDPGEIFIEMIRSLLGSKRAALSNLDGLAPDPDVAAECGWQRVEISDRGGLPVPSWELAPGAARIGWIDGGMVYLDPNASHSAVERFARDIGQVVGSKRQVCARLAETERIQTDPPVKGKRRRFTRRITVEKHRRELLCMVPGELFLPKT